MPWPDDPCPVCYCADSIHDLYGCTHCPTCDKPAHGELPPEEPEVDPWVADTVKTTLERMKQRKRRRP